MVPAITYFRTFRHYHRPEKLNNRVRNGNVCFLLGKVTGDRPGHWRTNASGLVYQRGSGIKRRLQRAFGRSRKAHQAHSYAELGDRTLINKQSAKRKAVRCVGIE
jgi:hypothetical protein